MRPQNAGSSSHTAQQHRCEPTRRFLDEPRTQKTGGMMRFQRPQPLQENIPAAERYERWLDWKGSFDVALSVCEGNPSEQQKAALLFTSVGPETQKTIRLLALPPMQKGDWSLGREYLELSNGLNSFFRGMVDEAIDFSRFHGVQQEHSEGIHKYTLRVRGLAVCVNIDPSSSAFRHQLLKGMRDRELAIKATDENIPLSVLIQTAARKEHRGAGVTTNNIETWRQPEAPQTMVAAVSTSRGWRKNRAEKRPAFGGQHEGPGNKGKSCRYCGHRQHEDKKLCPAHGKECHQCGTANHFAAMCEKKKLSNEQGGFSAKDPEIFTVTTPNGSRLVNCSIGYSSACELLIDSGSDWNVLSESDWSRINTEHNAGKATIHDLIENPGDAARAFGATDQLKALRSFHAWVEVPGAAKPRIFAKFRVVANGRKSLLGHITATRMQLLKVGLQVNAVSEEKEPVEFPSIPNFILDFDIDPDVPPTKNAYVNIPAAYMGKAIERLRRMEAEKIIEKVNVAPKWISGMSAVPKGKDDFRLVINMIGPNRAIRRRFHKMPTLEDVRVKLNGAKFFTKLDLTNAFYHIVLGRRSRELTTFLGPDGMYRFVRLVFGVNCAPEAFQQQMESILRDIPNLIIYIDDLLIFANNLLTLRKITEAVLKALAANNLTLNVDKCAYEQTELEFVGHKLSANGFNITEKKVEDVRKFRSPKNTSELKSFLGLATFLSAYIGRFATIAKPLWDVAKAREFAWTDSAAKAFEELKDAIINCTISQGFFNPDDKTQLYTDASPVALGAVLVQTNSKGESRVISFASKLLSPTEGRYPQTQKEALAIVWGAEHFWYYLLGRKFTIRTDAQGISFILKKERTNSSRILSRAAGWALRLTRFDFNVEFVEGKNNIADPSSRLLDGEGLEFEDNPAPGEIMTLSIDDPSDVTFGDGCVTIEEVKWHADRDQELKAATLAVQTGVWTKKHGAFKTVKNELRLRKGVLTRMGQAVIPTSLRPKTLAMAHRGHPGEKAMKSILRGKVWWPGMMAHADNWVKSCPPCTLMARRNPPMPMLRSHLPAAPWEELACDFNGPYKEYNGMSILAIVDSYTRFLIARPVRSTDFNSTRAVFDDVFDTYGNVLILKSDNGPPFNGAQHRQHMASRGIEVKFSTPLDAQQNGGIETYMRIINKAMAAASVEKSDWRRSLADTVAAHNSADCTITGIAPEELMFGRKLRRNLPMIEAGPVTHKDSEVRKKDWSAKMKAKAKDDAKRGAKYSDIAVGDKVYVSRQTKAKGETRFDPTEFTVISKNHGTLELLSPLGNILKRTVTFVKKVTERKITDHEQENSPTTAAHVTERAEMKGNRPQAIPIHEPRKSTRTKKKPARLGDFVGLLGWEL